MESTHSFALSCTTPRITRLLGGGLVFPLPAPLLPSGRSMRTPYCFSNRRWNSEMFAATSGDKSTLRATRSSTFKDSAFTSCNAAMRWRMRCWIVPSRALARSSRSLVRSSSDGLVEACTGALGFTGSGAFFSSGPVSASFSFFFSACLVDLFTTASQEESGPKSAGSSSGISGVGAAPGFAFALLLALAFASPDATSVFSAEAALALDLDLRLLTSAKPASDCSSTTGGLGISLVTACALGFGAAFGLVSAFGLASAFALALASALGAATDGSGFAFALAWAPSGAAGVPAAPFAFFFGDILGSFKGAAVTATTS
mmetsp:Transcript_21763/g.39011  ORF Transcript_21763/g.39011 Transcript_21763/m.39011 type:complete len:316 (+) Transcript_21763:1729-2676(+)